MNMDAPMRTRKFQIRLQLLIALISVLSSAPAPAQNTAQARSIPSDQTAPELSATAPSEKDSPPAHQALEIQSLDGSGILSIRRPRLFVGGSLSSGFDSNPQNLGNAKSSFIDTVSPYIGLGSNTARTQFVLQYHPTLSRFTNYAGEVMHIASARIVGSLSPRLHWDFGVTGSHGNDSLRLLSAVLPGSSGASNAFLPNAGISTNLDTSADLFFDASPRNFIALHFVDSYNSFPTLHQKGTVSSLNLSYSHAVTPALSYQIYEDYSLYRGDLNCTAVGAGFGIRWQPAETTVISAQGGPQLDTPSCKRQEGFSYSTNIVRKLLRRSQLTFSADRQPLISYLGSGLWQDDLSAGYERQIQMANTLSFDVGFVHSSTLLNASTYHGTFFDAAYMRRLHKGLSLGASYRTFFGASNGDGITRNIFQLSLTFTPNTPTSPL
jgi:hypothetical protein